MNVKQCVAKRVWEERKSSWKYIRDNSEFLYKLGFQLTIDSLDTDKRLLYNRCLDESEEILDSLECEERTKYVVGTVLAGLLYLRAENPEIEKPKYLNISDEEVRDLANEMVAEARQTLAETDYVEYFLDTLISSYDNGAPVSGIIFAKGNSLCISIRQAIQKINRDIEIPRQLNIVSAMEHFRGHEYYVADKTKGSPFNVYIGDDLDSPRSTTKRGLVFDLVKMLFWKPRLAMLLTDVEKYNIKDFLLENNVNLHDKLVLEGVFDA